ncbi:hypothetical protein GXW82_43350 [Streptacidiphilus sp. 4-A2]|nr:hypothetical protein [Streptacidiphilus sp. 4-A2]
MPSVLGVLERRERVALARAEELRAELERLQAAVAEADEAARRAVIAREETVVALAEAAEEAVVVGVPVNLPAAGVAGPRVEVPLWCEGWGSRCCRRVRADRGPGPGGCRRWRGRSAGTGDARASGLVSQ